jgi:secreted PhoX family phosphatase
VVGHRRLDEVVGLKPERRLAGQGRSSDDGSTIVDDDDAFASPDGIWSDPHGRVWIQTDGTQPLGANDQMLAANPYVKDSQGSLELRRFLTGIPDGEVTDVMTTPDQRTMFVNPAPLENASPSPSLSVTQRVPNQICLH